MRAVTIVTLLLPLAACAGGGVESAGSFTTGSASTAATSTSTSTTTPTTTTTTTPTTSTTTPTTTTATTTTAASTPTTATVTPTQANMFDVTTATTFDAVGAVHSLSLNKDGSSLYQGNASTVAAPSGKISYDPRDGIFVMTLTDTKANVTRNITFQDPGHRTTADAPYVERQVPLLTGFNYLSVLDGTTPLTFFYQRPNSAGSFVSLAGFERNELKADGSSLSEQGVLVFGSATSLLQTPTKGTARFDGQFLATMMAQQGSSAPVQQWINGTSAVDVDFAKRTVALSLSGTVGPVFVKNDAVASGMLSVPSGARFTATGSAAWTTASTAFAGKFTSAGFTSGTSTTPIDFTPVSAGTTTAGASSIDGTFYGPDAKNIGGNFRIVGGIPNQRVDILGGFVGTRP